MAELNFSQPARADHGIHGSAEFQRIRPQAIADFARDLTSLLETASASDIGFERTQQLNDILGSFEVLFADMQRLRGEISASLDECRV